MDNRNVLFESAILEWYKVEFPTDEDAIEEMNEDATFSGLFDVLDMRKDVYDYIGFADSMTRERIFIKLAEIMGVEYDYIYTQWLEA